MSVAENGIGADPSLVGANTNCSVRGVLSTCEGMLSLNVLPSDSELSSRGVRLVSSCTATEKLSESSSAELIVFATVN